MDATNAWRTLKILETIIILLRHLVRVFITRRVFLGIDVEALGVAGVPNGWDDRASVLPLYYGIPVDAVEEWMRLDSRCAAADVAEASRSVDGAQLPDDVFCCFADWRVLREYDGFFYDS